MDLHSVRLQVDSSNKEVENPEFHNWKQIDAHLLSCITATLHPSIYTNILHCKTSQEIWYVLNKRVTALFRSHIHQLQNKWNNKSSSMESYLQEIEDLVDQLIDEDLGNARICLCNSTL